ncbi:hypothetical protein QYE76_041375 [Lolium multiflorum]|uniref:Reverse transcriptase zinc-binding domain-containing protein n=1 Tax=Lolium multiflorum TaxID=4521 RepID=A0AAD8TEU7_LOLMU|nr:hypothetical protein QYE76_041375 [Lolium multiflorum]
MYHTLSVPTIGDDERASFWLDDWTGRGTLCRSSPALFSHALKPLASVAATLRHGIATSLVPRLTIVAEQELADVLPLLEVVCLVAEPGEVFRLLLIHSRIQKRAALLKKHILTASKAVCQICGCADESATHIIFRCPFVVAFWDTIGSRFPPDADVLHLHEYAAPTAAGALPASTSTFVILCCWHVWKHRNKVVFQHDTPSLTRLLDVCCRDAALWRGMAPEAARSDTDLWDGCFAPVPSPHFSLSSYPIVSLL